MIDLANFRTSSLVRGFLSSFSRMKQASDDSEVPEAVAAGAGLGGAVGAIAPFFLARYRYRIAPAFLNERFTTALGSIAGGIAGGFAGEWLPRSIEHAQKGFDEGKNIFRKQSDETLQNAGKGALIGSGIGAAAALPILLGRLGRRLPRKLLGKMVLGQAALGAVTGGAASGITSKERPNEFIYHYNYHGTKPSSTKNVSV